MSVDTSGQSDTSGQGGASFELDIPSVQGNLLQTLSNLIALRMDVLQSATPSYSVHGHAMKKVEFYQFLSDEITAIQKQLSQFQPWEFTSIGR